MTVGPTVRWLARVQHPAGSWTDFFLAPGPSSGWVTAYVGVALACAAADPRVDTGTRRVAAASADAAARYLLRSPGDVEPAGPASPAGSPAAGSGLAGSGRPSAGGGRGGGWGWTAAVNADADSTAWAVRLLALRGWPVPPSALDFLAAHRDGGGYRTYRSAAASGAWAAPAPEVTAAALLARHAAGSLDGPGLAAEWCALLAAAHGPDGAWHSMWWPDPAYPTAVVGAAWVAAARPPFPGLPSLLARAVRHAPPEQPCGGPRDHAGGAAVPRPRRAGAGQPAGAAGPAGAGGNAGGRAAEPAREPTAWACAARLWAASVFGAEGRDELAAELLARRREDGGWPGGAVLRVPAQRTDRPPLTTRDARGIFTTATALHALLAGDLDPAALVAAASRPAAPRPREAYDDVVRAVAAAAGADTGLALAAFEALTRESLARDGVWPARQLSNLAGGTPLEFSVGAAPALRLTTEVGDPLLPPADRAGSGLRAIGRAAALLGMTGGWRAARPAAAALTDPLLPVPDGCRFWVWAGLDLTPGGRAVLKTYLSLHAEDLPGWPAREASFLDACGVPRDAPVHAVLERMRRAGWCHEVGVGLAGGTAWGAKIYYELAGYDAAAVRDVLDLCGLDPDPAGLAPEVPGVLRTSLAAKRRSGIAVRVHPSTGRVDEVTVAAAFPAPLVGRDEVAARVQAWLTSLRTPDRHDAAPGPSGPPAAAPHPPDEGAAAPSGSHAGEPHRSAAAALRPGWRGAPPLARMHSLLTRSRSAHGDETKVYLRPWLPGSH